MQLMTSPSKKIMFKFLLLVCFWSLRLQLNFGCHTGRGVIQALA